MTSHADADVEDDPVVIITPESGSITQTWDLSRQRHDQVLTASVRELNREVALQDRQIMALVRRIERAQAEIARFGWDTPLWRRVWHILDGTEPPSAGAMKAF